MDKRKIFDKSIYCLYEMYNDNLDSLINMNNKSSNYNEFIDELRVYCNQKLKSSSKNVKNAAKSLNNFLENEGNTIRELSKDKEIKIETFHYLYLFLNEDLPDYIPTDLFIDLYFLFLQLEDKYKPLRESNVEGKSRRWKSGMHPSITKARKKNKDRMIKILIEKINNYSQNNQYCFPEGISYKKKIKMVEKWWNDYRFQINMAARSPFELNKYLNNSLSDKTMELLQRAKEKGIPFFATPYYLSLLYADEGEYFNDEAIRCYVIYSEHLVNVFGNINAWEREDQVEEGKPNAAGWIIPAGGNVHRRYPEVAILIPDTIGRSCGGLCAVCQRMYDFQSKRLNFNHDKLIPSESWPQKLTKIMDYFENDPELKDILITGGDALMSQNASLKKILYAVLDMAKRKINNNKNRPKNKQYAEIKRVRLGTRLPVYLPMRIDKELIEILSNFKDEASKYGINQFVIQTHFESPLEVTPDSKKAINLLNKTGWTVTNQLVFTVPASRKGHTAKLRKVLNKIGVICYYTFSVKGFDENYELYAPLSRSIQESIEEKSVGKLTDSQTKELLDVINNADNKKIALNNFLDKHKLPFVATDRNVLNIPGIGKSMTFENIGITPSGKRIFKFDYDHTRKHSPITEKIPFVYIVENKSIANYLRDLTKLGETVNQNAALWNYRFGTTEPCFGLFEYY
ncbi:MAG: KamA family radical SAM protein [Bacteroidales bacterium]